MKRNLTWLAASLAALCAGAAGAQTYYPPAQSGYGYDDGYGQARTVRCESVNSRQARCRIDGAGDVRITRQLSRQQCIQGRNWDFTRDEIRVADGCRAEFLVMPRNDDRYGYDDRDAGRRYGQDQVVRCDSRSQRRTYCADGHGQYTMVGYRDADCVQGRTYGQDDRGLWVAGNCSARFRRVQGNDHNRYGRGDGRQDQGATLLRCYSNSSGRSYCGDANARYTLRDTGNRYCVEGRTWGTDQRGLWVSNPCQAEFIRQPFGDGTYDDRYRSGGYEDQPYSEREYQRD
jgi:hypothetical protein